jgi:hypothetical protein
MFEGRRSLAPALRVVHLPVAKIAGGLQHRMELVTTDGSAHGDLPAGRQLHARSFWQAQDRRSANLALVDLHA